MAQGTAVGRADSPRKLQLVSVAGRLFQEHGFHKVSMDDIAQAVGLRGPALYRHFSGKQELLTRVVLDQITVCLEVAEEATKSPGDAQDRLDTFVNTLGRLVLDRDEVMLWRWERRYLEPEAEIEFRRRARSLEERTATLLKGVRADLPDEDIRLLSWALLSTLAHTRGLARATDSSGDRNRALALQRRMAGAVVAARWPAAESNKSSSAVRAYVPFGRRERILEVATELFCERGFFDVSIDEIAAASDTAIATIYQYFESKVNLLYTILDRGIEGVNYVTVQLLAGVESHEDRVNALITNYVDLSMGPHGRLFRIFDEQLVVLPEEQRAELLFAQRGHNDEWAGALQQLCPDLTLFESRVLARTATGVASDIAQTARLRRRATTRGALTSILNSIVRS